MSNLPAFISNHLFLVCLFIALLTLLLWDIFTAIKKGAKTLSPQRLTLMINQNAPVLVDLRPTPDFTAGHIITAINMPANEFEGQLKKLKRHTQDTIILYCENGARCTQYAKKLQANGFSEVYTLKGGLLEWRNANLPLQKTQT